MSIRLLVIDAIKCIKLEYKLIDKMLTALENQNEEQYEIIQECYKNKKAKTDYVIGTLLLNFPLDEILKNVSSFIGSSFVGFINTESLGEIIIDDFFDARYAAIFDKQSPSYNEEHIKYLLSTYLWDSRNSGLSEVQKKKVHQLVLPLFAKSGFIRSLFAGDLESAEIVSTPDKSFGKFFADKEAMLRYYKFLNKIIKECDAIEYFEGLDNEDNCSARRKFAELQIAALSTQMESRNLIFPCVECPISDFAEERIANATELVRRIANDETRTVQKVIKL